MDHILPSKAGPSEQRVSSAGTDATSQYSTFQQSPHGARAAQSLSPSQLYTALLELTESSGPDAWLLGWGPHAELRHHSFLEDGRHVFVSGKPLSNPQNLTCWQVISIPDGLTKAVAWRQLDAYESAHRVAGRHIMQSKSLGSL